MFILGSMSIPSLNQLKRAITISEQIEKLQAELQSILGSTGGLPAKRKYTRRALAVAAPEGEEAAAPTKRKKRKVKMSAEGRARIIAAQKARWAKVRKEKSKKQGE